MAQVATDVLHQWLNALLQPERFQDYCPNGLQLEGKDTIGSLVMGVTASHALIEAAIHRNADAILVHHGWFWKNENPCITGAKRQRIALALEHNLNIFAYHLPLDAHPKLGNNAQLAQVLGLIPDVDEHAVPLTCASNSLVWLGRTAGSTTLKALGQHIEHSLNRAPLLIGEPQQPIERIAWCTGGAQGMMQAAIDAGVQAYITGEASEPNYHQALEAGVAFIAAGHHATERYGVQAVGQAIQNEFGIQVEFIDLDNPI